MGGVAVTSSRTTHAVKLTALPAPGDRPLSRVELIGRGGRVLWARDGFPGGTIEISMPGLAERGYLLARVLATDATSREWRQPSRVAVGNPVTLHPAGCDFERPAVTRARIRVLPRSPFAGGEIRFEAMDGALLGRASAAAGTVVETLPATGRLTLVARDGRRRTDYLLNANAALQSIQRYLYRGRFLRDFPHAQSGEVPAEAWQLDAFAAALREVSLEYGSVDLRERPATGIAVPGRALEEAVYAGTRANGGATT
jgi:hypothetical protein